MALIRYMFMLMPPECRAAPVRGVGPRVGVRVDTDLHPQADPGAAEDRDLLRYCILAPTEYVVFPRH